ncbi:hypothetical protein HDK77DRAFT_430647 [Phyllosticta capitalensis]
MDVFLANCHRWGEGVAAGADQFFAHDAPSFFCEVGKHLDRAGHESRQGFEGAMAEAGKSFEGTLRCTAEISRGTIAEAGKHLDRAGYEAGKSFEGTVMAVGESLEGTRRCAEEFFTKGLPEFFAQNADALARLLADAALFFKYVGENVFGPAVRDALQQLAAGVSASLAQIDITARRTQRFFEHMAKRVGEACASTFVSIKWDQIPKKVRAWVEQHPWQTAFYVACGVVFIVPALAYGPALGMLGFSAAGPVAGSLAASIQSAYSPVVAGGVFATLQSAAMGGYGAATVAALTQAGAATAGTAVGLSNIDSAKGDKDEKEE